MSDTLFNTLTEEEPHQWSDQDLWEALMVVRPMISVALQDRLNPGMTALVAAGRPGTSSAF